MDANECPAWCRGGHVVGGEHASKATRLGEVLVELIQSPGDDEVHVSLLDFTEGGRYFELPMPVVPQLHATVLRLSAPVTST